jgi:hypothetical protein
MGVRATTIYGKTLISYWDQSLGSLGVRQESQMSPVLVSLGCLKQKLTKFAKQKMCFFENHSKCEKQNKPEPRFATKMLFRAFKEQKDKQNF